jgi:sulfur carrier protein
MSTEPMQSSIRVNGTEEPLRTDTVAALVAEKTEQMQGRGIAVSVNGMVVLRAAWPTTPLKPGDRVEIVRVLQGG